MVFDINEEEINLENSMDYIDSEYESIRPSILVFGVGGGGVNAVNSMFENNELVKFVVANTDSQSLANSIVKNKILIGREITHGLGAGMIPEVGKNAAEESIKEIEKALDGINMVFLTAGMGGGTGTGAIPVIAKKAKEMGILVVAIVTKPFTNEGNNKMKIAEEGIRELKKYVDTLIVVPNQNLLRVANQSTKLEESLKMVNDVLKYAVRGIADLITKPGFINLDFSDIKTIMNKAGRAMMGTGEATGENKTEKAVEETLSNPLLDNVSIKGAKGIIINVTSSPDITLFEYNNAISKIKDEVDNDSAAIIVGNVLDKTLEDTIRISIFATGIPDPDNDYDEYNDNYDEDEDIYENKYKFVRNNIRNMERYSKNFDYNEKENYELEKYNIDKKEYIENNYKNNIKEEYEERKKMINNIQHTNEEDEFDKKQIRKRIGDYKHNENDYYDIGKAAVYDEFKKSNKKEEDTQKNQKKQGFFSSLFNSSEKGNVINNTEEDDFDINLEYYNNTPAYLRKRRKE